MDNTWRELTHTAEISGREIAQTWPSVKYNIKWLAKSGKNSQLSATADIHRDHMKNQYCI